MVYILSNLEVPKSEETYKSWQFCLSVRLLAFSLFRNSLSTLCGNELNVSYTFFSIPNAIMVNFDFENFLLFNGVKDTNDKILDLIFYIKSFVSSIHPSQFILVPVNVYHVPIEVIISNHKLCKSVRYLDWKILNFEKTDYMVINVDFEKTNWIDLFSVNLTSINNLVNTHISFTKVNKEDERYYSRSKKKTPKNQPRFQNYRTNLGGNTSLCRICHKYNLHAREIDIFNCSKKIFKKYYK